MGETHCGAQSRARCSTAVPRTSGRHVLDRREASQKLIVCSSTCVPCSLLQHRLRLTCACFCGFGMTRRGLGEECQPPPSRQPSDTSSSRDWLSFCRMSLLFRLQQRTGVVLRECSLVTCRGLWCTCVSKASRSHCALRLQNAAHVCARGLKLHVVSHRRLVGGYCSGCPKSFRRHAERSLS